MMPEVTMKKLHGSTKFRLSVYVEFKSAQPCMSSWRSVHEKEWVISD
jgi:hypothetical protein